MNLRIDRLSCAEKVLYRSSSDQDRGEREDRTLRRPPLLRQRQQHQLHLLLGLRQSGIDGQDGKFVDEKFIASNFEFGGELKSCWIIKRVTSVNSVSVDQESTVPNFLPNFFPSLTQIFSIFHY